MSIINTLYDIGDKIKWKEAIVEDGMLAGYESKEGFVSGIHMDHEMNISYSVCRSMEYWYLRSDVWESHTERGRKK